MDPQPDREAVEHLRRYYTEGQPPEFVAQFEAMVREMAHLRHREQVGTFGTIYALSGKPPALVCSAIGLIEKAIDRGYIEAVEEVFRENRAAP